MLTNTHLHIDTIANFILTFNTDGYRIADDYHAALHIDVFGTDWSASILVCRTQDKDITLYVHNGVSMQGGGDSIHNAIEHLYTLIQVHNNIM